MNNSRRLLAGWLGIVCVTIFTMIVVGGITRLTESGLSMVDWRPVMGIIPPTSEAEWEATFEAYKQFPEYQKKNLHFTLDEFKSIFYWEYGHRVLGRLIGLMYFLPLVFFWLRGHVEPAYRLRLIIGLLLGGMQGLMGWYMVKSGLIDMPRVSHYRLAAHLSLALIILAYLFWLMLDLLQVKPVAAVQSGLRKLILLFAGLLSLQIVYGAFVAGSRAGWGYNTWPDMNGEFLPDAVLYMQPFWHNLLENTAGMQFIHRWLGAGVALLAVSLAVLLFRTGDTRLKNAGLMLVTVTFLQFILGVLTLIYVVPISLGALHQAVACLLLVTTVWLVFITRPYPNAQGDRARV
ncbi:MAG: COX15/CtaA family protein [Pseudomonadales bacterium]|nr:COX15/CtaA family protein [Pseudomonadales bacterium]